MKLRSYPQTVQRMRYSQAVKSEVRQLYREGNPRSRISESKGITLSTIRLWTKEISPRVLFITCEMCGKQKRTLNIQRRYCSDRCRSHAYYRRERQKSSPAEYSCAHCGERYSPTHGNQKFCTVECRQQAAIHRAYYRRRISRQVEETFNAAMGILFRARKSDPHLKIDQPTYRSELDIVQKYYDKNKDSLSEREIYNIQFIFQAAS